MAAHPFVQTTHFPEFPVTRFASCLAVLLAAASANAEVKVTLSGVHLCCGGCVKGAEAALKDVEGASAECSREKQAVTVTAADDATAKKALLALRKAGYYGKSDSKTLAIPTIKKLPEGKVETMTLAGFHNCCGSCARSLKETASGVDGVKEVTVKKKQLVATGEFDAAALIKAMNEAGFSVRVPKKK